MTAKEEKIKEAYGEYYNKCKPDENGWSKFYFEEIGYNVFGSEAEYKSFSEWRPKSLSGIETNNGWTRIESEEDLPIRIQSKKIIFRTKHGTTTTYFSEDIVSEIPNHFLKYSHWRLKEEIPEPIY